MIQVVKFLDRILGTLMARALPKAPSSLTSALRQFLVIRPGGIGDAVLLVPALAALRKKFPHASITVLAEARNAAVFRLTDVVDDVLLYHHPAELWAVLKGGHDVIVDTEQWHRLSAVVTRLAHPSVSVGYATNERKKLFSHPIPYSHEDHEMISFLNLLVPLGVPIPRSIHIPFLSVPDKVIMRTRELLGYFADVPYVVVFPGTTVAEKRWDVEKYSELATRVSSKGLRVVVIGGKEDADAGAKVVRDNGLNLAGKTTLSESAAIIQRAKVVITGDSGVMHLAYGLGTPSVSLFGPSNVQKWAPQGSNHITIHRGLSCSPCSRFGYTPPCPLGVACMSGISVDEVAEAAFRLLRR